MNISLFKKMSHRVGLPPGSLVSGSDVKKEKVTIRVIDYDEKELVVKQINDLNECSEFKEKQTVSWINVNGIHDISIIEHIGNFFSIHPLVLEDITHTTQRPKVENYDDFIFIVIKMITYNETAHEIRTEQVSLLLGDNFVLTFQELEGDVFNIIRDRIRESKGKIRRKKADYLAYALIDAIVDHYFLVLEKIGDEVEILDEELVSNPTKSTQIAIHNLKREMLFLRKSVWPLREVVNGLMEEESSLIDEGTVKYLRDVYDHTIQIIDTVETLRDIVSSLLDLYLSSLSNKMNEVMKVLTIMSSLFIPITFIAGVYGMNFENIPELKFAWGYGCVWGVFILVVFAMLLFFKKKKWF